MNKPTIGKVATDLLKNPAGPVSVIEQQREMQKDYINNLIDCVERYKKEFPNDFYIIVLVKKERLLPNVLRNLFFARLSCPTPEYDQTVYKYQDKDEKIEFLWTIPSKEACAHLKDNALIVDKEEKELLNFVLDFDGGSLLRKVKELNNEDKLSNKGTVCKRK